MNELPTLSNVNIPDAMRTQTGAKVKYEYDPNKQWFVFRACYGREQKASDYLVEDGTYVYIAKRLVRKGGGLRTKYDLQVLIPNLLFVYTTRTKADMYIKSTSAISYVTYYLNHFITDEFGNNPPLTVSHREMMNFITATCNHNEHIMFVNASQVHYRGGELVRVIDGDFRGVVGKVARVAGQQRVVLSITNVGLVSTAYIPTAFIEPLG